MMGFLLSPELGSLSMDQFSYTNYTNSVEKPHPSRDVPHNSPILQAFASRIMKSVVGCTSSMFLVNTPSSARKRTTDKATGFPSIYDVDYLHDPLNATGDAGDKQADKKPSTLTKYKRQQVPRFPFCEEYDGVNMRKTRTISESIMQIINSRRRSDESHNKGYVEANKNDNFKSAIYSENINSLHNVVSSNTKSCRRFSQMYEPRRRSDYNSNCSAGESCDERATDEDNIYDSNDTFRTDSDPDNKSIKHFIARSDSFLDCAVIYEERGIDAATFDLELKYDMETEKLNVKILGVVDVTDLRDNNKLIDSFVKLSIFQRREKKKRTRVAKKSRDPKFCERFVFDQITLKWLHITCLHVQLYQKRPFKNICLGDAFIWLDDYDVIDEDKISLTELFQPAFV